MEQQVHNPYVEGKRFQNPSRRYFCCIMFCTLLLIGLIITVGIFALKWGDHRRDARFNYVSNSQYQYLPAFPYTFSVTDPANSANVFNYPLTNTQANMLANNMIEDRIHPLDPHQLYYKEMKTQAIYLFVTAGVLIFLVLFLMMAFCCDCVDYRRRHVFITLIILLIFAVAIVMLLRHCNNQNLEDTPIPYRPYLNLEYPLTGVDNTSWRTNFTDFNKYYKLVLALWIAAFFWVIILFCVYCTTLNDVSTYEVLHPVVVEIPPTTNRNL